MARFYTRLDCPLCETAWQLLESAGVAAPIVQVDISTDDQLMHRYGWRIPVLKLADGREFDLALEDQLQRALEALSTGQVPSPI